MVPVRPSRFLVGAWLLHRGLVSAATYEAIISEDLVGVAIAALVRERDEKGVLASQQFWLNGKPWPCPGPGPKSDSGTPGFGNTASSTKATRRAVPERICVPGQALRSRGSRPCFPSDAGQGTKS